MSELTEQDARDLIESVDRNLKRWVAWFPNEMTEVEVPRRQLLALKYFAEIGLKAACEKQEPTNLTHAIKMEDR